MKSTKQFLKRLMPTFWSERAQTRYNCLLSFCIGSRMLTKAHEPFTEGKSEGQRHCTQWLPPEGRSLLYPKGQWIPAAVKRRPAGDLTLLSISQIAIENSPQFTIRSYSPVSLCKNNAESSHHYSHFHFLPAKEYKHSCYGIAAAIRVLTSPDWTPSGPT